MLHRAGPSPGCVSSCDPFGTILSCREVTELPPDPGAGCPLVRTVAGGSGATRLWVLGPLSLQRAGGECRVRLQKGCPSLRDCPDRLWQCPQHGRVALGSQGGTAESLCGAAPLPLLPPGIHACPSLSPFPPRVHLGAVRTCRSFPRCFLASLHQPGDAPEEEEEEDARIAPRLSRPAAPGAAAPR